MGAAPKLKRARLNAQGLARRDPGLMRCLAPDEGMVTCSIDLSAGEPSVTSHFSRDPRYIYACFDGVWKDPHYKDGLLWIDDIYLMCMSVSPLGREAMHRAFREQAFEGLSFVDQWRKDPEVVKRYFKKERQLHKMLCLALGYGMGPKKMVKQCYDSGYVMDLKTAKAFFAAYWDLFIGVKKFADFCARKFERDGYLVNPFGYRLVPDQPYKAFNAFIQSTVSGIMHVFCEKLMTIAPYADFLTVVHDELLADIPIDRVDDFRRHSGEATASLNEDLDWSVAIRTGFVTGPSWYEAK